MKIIWGISLFLLTLFATAEAKPIASQDSTPLSDDFTPSHPVKNIQSYKPEVLVFVELLKADGISTTKKDWGQSHVLLVVQQDDGATDNGKDLAISDPNILLMVENFQSNEQWPESRTSPRLARDMSRDDSTSDSDPDYLEAGISRGNYYDLWIVPRRSRTADPLPPPGSLLPPPSYMQVPTSKQHNAEYSAQTNGNRVSGRSISTTNPSPNHPYNNDDDPPDFLSTLVTLPQVWMHDLSHMIIQPLRKPSSGERDSFEYFGMVGKAPFIQCPLGFKKSSLGTCRPVFRSRRNYPMSSAQEPELEIESTTTKVETTLSEDNMTATSTSS